LGRVQTGSNGSSVAPGFFFWLIPAMTWIGTGLTKYGALTGGSCLLRKLMVGDGPNVLITNGRSELTSPGGVVSGLL
jgi:hypothetical protein